MRLTRISLPALSVAALLLTDCAINPATGKRQFVLISERQEIQIGRENDRVITEQMGLYDDDALQEYVNDLGQTLAGRSERPQLEWTFRVVDDPVVNAFALPGGYIYITRGILAHLNNEAELASILGHEIGHVTARHSVSQMSKAQLAQLGLGVGSVLAPEEMQRYGSLAQTSVGLVFLKFGRDDERQADDLGLRYIVAAGYDARPMADVFEMLERVSAAAGSGRVPGWMSTHPAPANRRERSAVQIAALGQDFSGRPVDREEFLGMIDGVKFGSDPRDGYFEDSVFYHPEMRFLFEFPRGWELQNQRAAVIGIDDDQQALIQLSLTEERTAEAAMNRFFSQDGVRRTAPPMRSIGGLPTTGDGFSVQSDRGAIEGRVGFVEYNGRVFRLMGYASETGWETTQSVIRRALASFRPLTDPKAIDVEPQRLDVVRVSRATTLEEFARRNGATVPVETLALINRLDPGERLQPGRSYKVVVGGKLP